MTKTDPGLEAAYSLKTPDDSRDLYARWADDYDSGFAEAEGYDLPKATAQVFAGAGGAGPVLDVGAGTGLCAIALKAAGIGPIDGVDISTLELRELRSRLAVIVQVSSVGMRCLG